MTLPTFSSSAYFQEKLKKLPAEKQKYFKHLGKIVDQTLSKTSFSSKKAESSVIYKFECPIIKGSTLEIFSVGKEIENYINFHLQKQSDYGNKFFLQRFNDMLSDFFYVLSSNENTQVKFSVDNSPHVVKNAKNETLTFSDKQKNIV